MNVLIFGATGGTGQQLIKHSLEHGYKTSVFIHDDQEKLGSLADKVKIFQGDVRDYDAVDAAIQGQDAVLVSLGVIPGRTQHILSQGTANIIRSMESRGVKRLVAITGAGLVVRRKQIPLIWRFMFNVPLLRGMFEDKRKQEAYIKKSNLEWIIIRPSNLTNGPSTSDYLAGEDLSLKTSSTVSRADVADFMVKQAGETKWLNKAVLLESNT